MEKKNDTHLSLISDDGDQDHQDQDQEHESKKRKKVIPPQDQDHQEIHKTEGPATTKAARSSDHQQDHESCKDNQELSVIQMEMGRMKEENRMLREVVEQTMKDYHHLQLEFSVLHQNHNMNIINSATTTAQNKDPAEIFLSLNGNRDLINRKLAAPKSIPRGNEENNDELGLSLRLQTRSSCNNILTNDNNEEELLEINGGSGNIYAQDQPQNNIQRTDGC